MDATVVWNLDPLNRPELEVEIAFVYLPDELPGMHYASARPELEVELLVVDSGELADEHGIDDPWFIDDDVVPAVWERPSRDWSLFPYAQVA